MARMPRERNLFGIYYISQWANDGVKIFRDDGDRQAFVDSLQGALKQYPSEILAYCLMDPTSYHLIVHFHGCDISQFMSSLNIRYARSLEHRGGLFKDRFQSELLNTDEEVHDVLDRLEKRGKNGREWNSFCDLDRLRGRTASLFMSEERPECFEITKRSCIATKKGLLLWLESALANEGLTMETMLEDKDKRNVWVVNSRRMSCLPLRELGEVFGGLSESMVSKIIKQGVHRA